HPDRGHWPLVMNHGGRFYFQPEGEGLLASPADETPCEPHDARADELAMAKATDALAEATTLEVRGVNSRWAGLRTFAPDRLPVIGFDPRAEGWFWLAGQGGGGIKTAPAMAELTRHLVLGSRSTDPVGPIEHLASALGPARLMA
ncbi:MAG: FAD-binding oxidoreductase, partial [Actinomycetia bacterium]|nr:FAD-binding oxidoreductase [Actinomycetes bacterium]